MRKYSDQVYAAIDTMFRCQNQLEGLESDVSTIRSALLEAGLEASEIDQLYRVVQERYNNSPQPARNIPTVLRDDWNEQDCAMEVPASRY